MRSLLRSLVAILCLGFATISAQAQGVSSSGTDYWLGFMPNGASDTYGGYDQLHLFIASSVDNSVRIDVAGDVRTIHVNANSVYDFDVPDIGTTKDPEVPSKNAIHVTSANPITIYGYSVWWFPGGIGGSPDGYLALPTTSYGTKYYTVNYYAGFFGSARTAGEFLVIAPNDNTQITITTKADTKANGNITHHAGDTWTAFLMKGQTYLVQSDNSVAGDNDLTGSEITSDKPIAVLTGHTIAAIPVDMSSADHLLEMIPSVDRWGTEYFDMPMAGRTQCGDYIRVLSAEDGNEITYNGKGPFHLDAGEFAERDLVTEPEVYKSINNKKFIVMQYSYSQGYNGDPGTADPFMILMTPQEQFETHMVFRTPTPAAAGTFNNYITFICVDSAIGKITIDGKSIGAYQYVGRAPFPSTDPVMSAYRIMLPGGSRAYFAEGPAPFGAYQYGFSLNEGYGWPTGMAQRIISPDTLAPLANILDSACGSYTVRYTEPRLMTNGYSFNDTKFAYLALITAANDPRWPTPSFNYEFNDSALQVGDSATVGTLTVIDRTKDAYAAVYAVDLAGNDTVFEYHYYAPKMTLSPAPVYSFRNVMLDHDSCITVHILNTQAAGNFPVSVAAIQGTSKYGDFTVSPQNLAQIPLADSLPITICYHPADTGVVDVDTILVSTACAVYRFPVEGSGITPLIYAEDVDFGEVDSGLTKCLPVRITNRGTAVLVITKQDLVSNPDFSVDPGQAFPITLQPGQSITIQYCFHPTHWGTFTTTVLFSDENPTKYKRSIKDTSVLVGVALPAGAKLTTYTKDFGLSGCSATPVLHDTLYNDQPSDKVITDVKIIGPDKDYFTIISTPPSYPFVLPGNNGATLAYDIQFNPMLNGIDFTPRTATLQVYTSDGQSQPAATLKGMLSTPLVSLSTSSIDFGIATVGGTIQKTFTISDTGNAPLTIAAYNVTGADAGSYSFAPPAPITIAPGTSQTITVSVTGSEARNYTAAVSFNSGCNADALAMQALFSKNADIALGTIHPKTYVGGCRSNTQDASFTNNNTNDSILFVGVSIQARNGWDDINDFALGTTIPTQNVPPQGGKVTVPIIFTPTTTGPRAAALVFSLKGKTPTGADTSWLEVVELQGEGVAVTRTLAIGGITTPVSYDNTPGKSFTVPVVVDQAIDQSAPDNGSTEVYGYRFNVTWNRDAFNYNGVDAPNAAIAIQQVGSPLFDATTNMETRTFQAVSSSPITGVTTLATLHLTAMLDRADSTPIALSNPTWLGQNGDSLCYIATSAISSNFDLLAACGTKTLQGILRGNALSGLLGNISPDPVTGNQLVANYSVATNGTHISMEIRDILGNLVEQVIQNQPSAKGEFSLSVDVSDLKTGAYFLRFTDGTGAVSTSRFSVAK